MSIQFPETIRSCTFKEDLYELYDILTDSMVVALQTCTYLYSIKDGSLFGKYQTSSNPKGRVGIKGVMTRLV